MNESTFIVSPGYVMVTGGLGLQLLTAVSIAATLAGLTYKLGHGMMRALTVAWTAHVLQLGFWLFSFPIRNQQQLGASLLAGAMTGAMVLSGHQFLQAIICARPSAGCESSAMHHPRRVLTVFLLGAALGAVVHYISHNLTPPGSLARLIWLRPIMVAGLLWITAHAWMQLRAGVECHTSLRPLLAGLICAVFFAVADTALRLAVIANGSQPGLSIAMISSAFLGTLTLGIGSLLATLQLEREHLRRQANRIGDDMFRAAENERLQSLGRLAEGIARHLGQMLQELRESLQLAHHNVPANYETARDDIHDALSALARGEGMKDRLLAYAQERDRRAEFFTVPNALGPMLPELRKMLPAAITLRHDLASRHAVGMDRAQFDQVILNLIVNARDAIRGTGEIAVAVYDDDVQQDTVLHRGRLAPGPYVRIEVTDSGCGICPTIVHSLFEPFVSTKGNCGTGLGLATVARVMHDCDGAIAVCSEPGRGTTFTLWVPSVSTDTRARIRERPMSPALPVAS